MRCHSGGCGTLNRMRSELPSNRRFDFQKRSQLFIGTHDEALSVQFRQLLKFTATGESGFTSLRAAADLCFLFDVRKS
jgi:hypothetical protein